jgi:D-glycero-alpha-D-manno-heptose-7-phosphate kinase
MIIVKTPYRISFCGGGTDLPGFYKKNNGQVLTTSIKNYIYVLVKKQTSIRYIGVKQNSKIKSQKLTIQ